MPSMPRYGCSVAGCPERSVHRGRCQKHAIANQKERDRLRGYPAQRGYGAAWDEISKAFRDAFPWCWLCGATDDLTTDHIVPLAHGGTHDPDNLRVLCRSCNSKLGGAVRRTAPR